MIYCGTLWWTPGEQELLNVKFDEGKPVDRWIISQATTSFRGKPREICYPETPAGTDVELIICDTSNVKGKGVLTDRRRNAIQRDATLCLVEDKLKPDDVFIFCDLDEILHEQDWRTMADAAREHGLVYAVMRRYYGKINLQAPSPWDSVFAVSGEFLSHEAVTVDKLRRRHKKHRDLFTNVRGQHFAWIYPSVDYSVIHTKSRNNSYEGGQGKMLKHIKQNRTPRGEILQAVPVDHTYPRMIRDNMDFWSAYIS